MKRTWKLEEFIKKIESSGEIVYYLKNDKEELQDHISISLLSSTSFFSGNSVQKNYKTFQIDFLTKNPYNNLKIDNFMMDNFNTSFTISYDTDEGWFKTVYQVSVVLEDE